jgi:hypothetical protein
MKEASSPEANDHFLQFLQFWCAAEKQEIIITRPAKATGALSLCNLKIINRKERDSHGTSIQR